MEELKMNEFDISAFDRLLNKRHLPWQHRGFFDFVYDDYIDLNEKTLSKKNVATVSYTSEHNAISSTTQPPTNVTLLKQEELFTTNNTNTNSNSLSIGNDYKTIEASTDISYVSTPVILHVTDLEIQQTQAANSTSKMHNTTASTEFSSSIPTTTTTNSSEKILYTVTSDSHVHITLPFMKAANIQNESEIVSTVYSALEDESTSPTVLTKTNLQVASSDEMRKAVSLQTTYLQSSSVVPKFLTYSTIKTIKLAESITTPVVGNTEDINTETVSSGQKGKTNRSIKLVVAIVFLSTGLTVIVFIAYIIRVKCKKVQCDAIALLP
ncbi:hypothetical protein X975_08911, partial [Stegodyphus mimosarum]